MAILISNFVQVPSYEHIVIIKCYNLHCLRFVSKCCNVGLKFENCCGESLPFAKRIAAAKLISEIRHNKVHNCTGAYALAHC